LQERRTLLVGSDQRELGRDTLPEMPFVPGRARTFSISSIRRLRRA